MSKTKVAGKKLLIVESPAKAKTIGKYLGDNYIVRASVGHVRDLPKSNKNAIDLAHDFLPHYEIVKGKEVIISDIRKLAQQAEEVLLATDPDREGEAIAWHIKEACGLANPQRVVFHEITKAAILEALEHPRTIDEHLRQAQEARRVLDRLFGYDLSGLIWKKLRYGLSAGRVQSPALRILVEREKEIRAFKPEDYWVISAEFKTGGGDIIPAECSLQPKSEQEARVIVGAGQSTHWQIKDIEAKEAGRKARPPFTTSTLQQAASSRLGYSPAQTMRLAQKLYEAGHITYMRTDSTTLSTTALTEAGVVITKRWGAAYHQRQHFATKSKSAQEAHEAIRPTQLAINRAGAVGPEQKLYELIWARTIASQMADAVVERTKVVVIAATNDIPPFNASGTRLLFPGWLAADSKAAGEEVLLPKLTAGEKLTLIAIDSLGKQTEGPARYSEAGLVKELEKRGIGRPSTYASTIKTIQDRGYAEKIERALQPTETGEVVSDFLDRYFHDYISDEFTAKLEDELDLIAEHKRAYAQVLSDFYTPFQKTVASKADIPKISDLGQADKSIVCPLCDGGMIVKLSRSGRFYSCARFPDCAGARKIDGTVLEPPKDLGLPCPDCTEGKLVEREGRFGKFVSCSRYPKCKYIKKDEKGGAGGAGDTGVGCPLCGQGSMVEKRGRFGIFYGCSHYPQCKNIIKTKPTGKLCSFVRDSGQPCGHLMMAGTKRIPDRCSDKTCPNHNPHKLPTT